MLLTRKPLARPHQCGLCHIASWNRLEENVTTAMEYPVFNPFRSAKARDRYLSRYDAHAGSWPVAAETTVVDTDNEETLVRISGPSEAPALVLLPAEWDSSLMWIPVIEALSGSYRTYAVDNPYDFGRSGNSLTSSSPVNYVNWLSQLFDGLGLVDGINLLGCSFGAWHTADYLLHEPHRLAKAVWLSPPFAVLSPPLESYVGGPLSMGAFLTPSRLSVRAYLRWLMPHAVGAPWFNERVDDVVWGLRGGFDERLALTEPRMLSDDELKGIDVPLLYVAGELEQMCSSQAAASRLNEVAPQIQTQIIPGAGHELPLGQSEELVQRILKFLG